MLARFFKKVHMNSVFVFVFWEEGRGDLLFTQSFHFLQSESLLGQL